MRRLLCLFVFLFLSFGSFGESFHFYRWSEQGHFSWFERGEDTQGDYYRFHIVDLISDDILVEEFLRSNWDSEEQIVQEIGRRYPRSIEEYRLQQGTMGQRYQGRDFQYQGKSYRLVIRRDEGETQLRILNMSDNQFKDVAVLGDSGDFQIQGVVLSPYEKRAAIILTRSGQFQVFGAHLTIGFQQTPYEGNELIEAVLCGQYYITQQLLEGDISPNVVDNRGYNALLLACRNRKWDIAVLLLAHGGDFQVQDALGNRPIHYAVQGNQYDFTRELCRAGASLVRDNNQGLNPLELSTNNTMDLLLHQYREE